MLQALLAQSQSHNPRPPREPLPGSLSLEELLSAPVLPFLYDETLTSFHLDKAGQSAVLETGYVKHKHKVRYPGTRSSLSAVLDVLQLTP